MSSEVVYNHILYGWMLLYFNSVLRYGNNVKTIRQFSPIAGYNIGAVVNRSN